MLRPDEKPKTDRPRAARLAAAPREGSLLG